MRAKRYPKARWYGDAHVYGDSVGTIARTSGAKAKCALHGTETMHWPGYNNGKSAPTFTYHPLTREWRQHADVGDKVGALRRPSQSYETNGLCVCQVEVIGYSSKATADRVGGLWLANLPDHAVADLAEFVVWLHDEWDLPLNFEQAPFADSRCYGDRSACRYPLDKFISWHGFIEHKRVTGNTHWDCDGLPWVRIMRRAREIIDGRGGTVVRPTYEIAYILHALGAFPDDRASSHEFAEVWAKEPPREAPKFWATAERNMAAAHSRLSELLTRNPCDPQTVADAAQARGLRSALNGFLGL